MKVLPSPDSDWSFIPQFSRGIALPRFTSHSTGHSTVLFLALIFCLLPAAAFAYIDPGTGSFVIQGIIAAVVGAGVVIKMFWHRIKGALGLKTDLEDDDTDD